jgi:AraC-like DNA-binding protein
MRNWKLPPHDSTVARYVECYWLLEKEHDDVGNIHPKLNPDPSAHLILAESQNNYLYTQDGVPQKGQGNHLIFPHSKTFVMDHSQPFRVIGVKFRVGALYSLALNSLEPKMDRVVHVSINVLIYSESFDVLELLVKAVDHPRQVCDRLDELLLPWLLDGHEDKHSELVRRALPLLTGTPIAQIGKSLHCSQRTIERSFLRVADLTLKQYQSMTRLEEMLNYLHQLAGESVNWVDVAAKFQFSDQPHLIRYLKSNIGTTPGQYARHRDLAIDVYGNFE